MSGRVKAILESDSESDNELQQTKSPDAEESPIAVREDPSSPVENDEEERVEKSDDEDDQPRNRLLASDESEDDEIITTSPTKKKARLIEEEQQEGKDPASPGPENQSESSEDELEALKSSKKITRDDDEESVDEDDNNETIKNPVKKNKQKADSDEEAESDDGEDSDADEDDSEEDNDSVDKEKSKVKSKSKKKDDDEEEEEKEGGDDENEDEDNEDEEGVVEDYDQDDRRKESRNNTTLYDFDIMMAKKKEENSRKRRRRNYDIINDDDDIIAAIINQMRDAVEEDNKANQNKMAATKKLKLLPFLMSQLRKVDYRDAFLDSDVLGVISEWLTPLPDRSLPHLAIRENLLKILIDFNLYDVERIKASGIGKAVMYLYKHPKETKENKQRAKQLISCWSRPIFQLDSSFNSISREEREQRDLELMSKQRRASKNDSPEEDRAGPSSGPRKKDDPAQKPGDKGWIPRARVPAPSMKDYVIRPRSKVDGDVGKSSKRPANMLEKYMKNQQERRRANRQQRAINMKIDRV